MKRNIHRRVILALFAALALALLPAGCGGGAPQEGERQDASA